MLFYPSRDFLCGREGGVITVRAGFDRRIRVPVDGIGKGAAPDGLLAPGVCLSLWFSSSKL